MESKLLSPEFLKKHFEDNGYNYLGPHNVINDKEDTIFMTAGIQTILFTLLGGEFLTEKKLYISQPVIRTQFLNNLKEGISLAFVNSTTSGVNLSQTEHNKLVNDWTNLFYELGLKKEKLTSKEKNYERNWGDLFVKGNKTFYYYNDIEIGDTTFFYNINKNGKEININTLSDVGFGLERIRWAIDYPNSYYDLYTKSDNLKCEIKGLLSALALLSVNDVKPSNNNSGYRVRLFSKNLAKNLDGGLLNENMEKYLAECIKYWKSWQEVEDIKDDECRKLIVNEFVRNGNRLIIDKLITKGYENISGININTTRGEFINRLKGSSINDTVIKEIVKE